MASFRLIYFINCGLMIIGAVFAALSTAGNYWEKYSLRSTIVHVGLWQFCGKPFSSSYCLERDKTDALMACEAFMIIGCLGYLLSLCYSSVLCIRKHWTSKVLAALLILTAICLAIALGVYTKEISIKESTFGWSYIIGWCSAAISLFAGILSFAEHIE
uniref:Claudin-like 15 n=1 Tax=Hydra vulgaris TaxID=6087 RepID=A0A0H5FN78_HYDVU|nr:Claudin-like 15 [Hydra vulgaris]